MDEKELIKSIEGGESDKLELKPSLSQINEIVEAVSGMANARGGHIIIGVAKSGRITGLEIGKDTVERLSNKIVNSTEPKAYPKISVENIDGKYVIAVEVKEAIDKPVLACGRAFKRVGKSTVRVSRDEYERMVVERYRDKVKFDEQICKDASYDDIDTRKVKWYLEQRENARKVSKKVKIRTKNLLNNLKVLKDGKPTNSGILFFGKSPQKFLPNAKLRIVKFKGTRVTHPTLDTLNCEGTVWEMIGQAEDFIRKNIRLLGIRTEKSFRREDKFEYPIKALREAIINALIHRDYFETGDVRVFIFDNMLEIINPGTFPKGVTPRNPKHRPVNEVLCNLVYDIGFIEKYGSGIYMMRELSRKWGNKEPYYSIHPVETKIIFESSVKEPTFVEIDVELNSRQEKAVEYVKKKGRITNKIYREINSVSNRIAFEELSQMAEKKILGKKGKGRSVYYVFR